MLTKSQVKMLVSANPNYLANPFHMKDIVYLSAVDSIVKSESSDFGVGLSKRGASQSASTLTRVKSRTVRQNMSSLLNI